MTGLLTLGEAMLTVAPTVPTSLAHAATARLSMAGSEATVAIGVSRLGHAATWISRVGDDEAGDLVRTRLLGEGVRVCAGSGPGPTGLMVKEHPRAGVRTVRYHRAGSAASSLSPADLPDLEQLAPAVVHVTGITPALSASAREATTTLVARAAAAGVPLSLDVNYRAKLWSTRDARSCLGALLPDVDLLFAGREEARLLLDGGPEDPETLAGLLRHRGPRVVVVTDGPRGAAVAAHGEVVRVPAVPAVEVDPFGAGDAFVAGFLASFLEGFDAVAAARRAAHVAAFAVASEGDWEGLPRAHDLTDGVPGPDILR